MPVPHLVLTIVAERQNVVQVEPQLVRQVDAASRADAPLHSVEAGPRLLRNLTPLIACPAAARRPLLVNFHRLQVFLEQRHVHGSVRLAVEVAATADPGDQLWRRFAMGLGGAAGQVTQLTVDQVAVPFGSSTQSNLYRQIRREVSRNGYAE